MLALSQCSPFLSFCLSVFCSTLTSTSYALSLSDFFFFSSFQRLQIYEVFKSAHAYYIIVAAFYIAGIPWAVLMERRYSLSRVNQRSAQISRMLSYPWDSGCKAVAKIPWGKGTSMSRESGQSGVKNRNENFFLDFLILYLDYDFSSFYEYGPRQK